MSINAISTHLTEEEILAACHRVAEKHPKKQATVQGVRDELGRGGNDRIRRHVKQFNADRKVVTKLSSEVVYDMSNHAPLGPRGSSGLAQIIGELEETYATKEASILKEYQDKTEQLAKEYTLKLQELEHRRSAFDAEVNAYKEEIVYLRNIQENHVKAVHGYVQKIAQQQEKIKAAEDNEIRFAGEKKGYEHQLEDLRVQLKSMDNALQQSESKANENADLHKKLTQQTAELEQLQASNAQLEEMYGRESQRLLLQVDEARQKTIAVMEKADESRISRQKTLDQLMLERSDFKIKYEETKKAYDLLHSKQMNQEKYLKKLKYKMIKKDNAKLATSIS